MNKKGFTLIELLAVIIILGILMIIAIPSVTKYINDSRKNSYVDTAKELIGGARNLVNKGDLGMYSTDTTYYIPSACIKTENGGEAESPYGKFKQAYIGVIYSGDGYKYYWISVDDSGQGIPNITPLEKLDVDLIESDLKESDIENTVINTGIGSRSEIYILDCQSNEWRTQRHLDDISGNASEEDGGGSSTDGYPINDPAVYPNGKTRATVEVGDIVTIKDEQFYVVKHDGNDLILLARYNLKVGNIYNTDTGLKIGEYKSTDTGYGLQSSDVRGYYDGQTTNSGFVAFSNTGYWYGKIGTDYPGQICNNYNGTNCAYIYDSNSNLYQYLENYKTYLGNGIKEVRLMSVEESYEFLNSGNDEAWYETSYWLGSAAGVYHAWAVQSFGSFGYDIYRNDGAGVRPVIVI